MYLRPNELNTHMYDYQLHAITEQDSSITLSAINSAIAEVKSYLATRYDVEAIFFAEGDAREPLILDFVKTISVWRIIKLANADVLYDKYRELYNDTITYLTKVSEGSLVLDLPRLKSDTGEVSGGSLQINSNPKFNHYI